MSALPDPRPVEEAPLPGSRAALDAIRAEGRPRVLRGLVDSWPAVAAARQGNEAMVRHLLEGGAAKPVAAIAAAPDQQGRFFYNDDLSGLNFMRGQGRLETFLADLLRAGEMDDPPGMAVQSETVRDLLPAFHRANRLNLLPKVEPRIWIGNRIRVAAHFDIKENIACCVAGRRRFTIFPPDQVANLYPGPFELTPAGTPVSLVDFADPDPVRHPGFAEALACAQQVTLEPGDAVYIPYCWWHGVESLDSLSILVNYWWTDGQPDRIGSPYDALLHAILSFRHLPPEQRAVWRDMLDYYVFEESGDPAAHLPPQARGVLGAPRPALFDHIRNILRGALG